LTGLLRRAVSKKLCHLHTCTGLRAYRCAYMYTYSYGSLCITASWSKYVSEKHAPAYTVKQYEQTQKGPTGTKRDQRVQLRNLREALNLKLRHWT